MIRTIFKIALLRLWNNKQELLLALLVPVLFFSIFAMIFSRGIGHGTNAIKVAIVDDDRSPLTRAVAQNLREQAAIEVEPGILYTNERWPLEKLSRSLIREHSVDVAIYLPRGLDDALRTRTDIAVRLLSEGSNPVSEQIVSSLVSQSVASALGKGGPAHHLTSLTQPVVATSTATAAATIRRLPPTASPASKLTHGPGPNDVLSFQTFEVFAEDKHNPKIAMYAAGIAVMFLLFSATGAGGSLLEEDEAGTLDRLLTSRLGVTELLAGKWLFITCLGCAQLTVMFAWAQVAFGVDLRGHLAGFAVMALCTAAATASLAICLAVLCRSRAQLNGVSIVLILAMSALGGSMVPRYIMSEEMQRWGQFTFNAWALDGFKKVFWYDLPVEALHVEINVLVFMTVLLAGLARMFADRWAAD